MIKDYVESVIHAAQQSNHVIAFDDRGDLRIESILDSLAKDKMISYDLIKQDDKGRWILNKKGLRFRSFKDEDRKMKYDFLPSKKEFVAAFIAAIFSLLTGYTLWRIDNQTKLQELKEIQQQLDKVTYRLDSLTNSQFYLQDSTKHN